MRRKSKGIESSGNVFADLGLKDADKMLLKAKLSLNITNAIKARQLTQSAAAKVLGISQPRVSKLMNGDLYGFSTSQLFRLLNALGQDVEIIVRDAPRRRQRGKLLVPTQQAQK